MIPSFIYSFWISYKLIREVRIVQKIKVLTVLCFLFKNISLCFRYNALGEISDAKCAQMRAEFVAYCELFLGTCNIIRESYYYNKYISIIGHQKNDILIFYGIEGLNLKSNSDS